MSAASQQQQQQAITMMDEFRAGLTACLRSWSPFRTAVESGWGGGESLSKAEDLRKNILEHMDGSAFPPARLTVDDLEDNLAIYLEEEFSVTLEDGSERQIAECLWRMYEGCSKGDPSLAREIVALSEKALVASAAYPVQIQSAEQDEDDDDDEAMEGNAPQLTAVPAPATVVNARDYANQYLFGQPPKEKVFVSTGPVRQLGDATPVTQEIQVDDDGFAPVVKNNRRKNR